MNELKDRVRNATASDFAIVLRGRSHLPELMDDYLTPEQWETIKKMIISNIEKRLQNGNE